MNKIVLLEAKYSVGAEEIGKALAESWNVPFVVNAAPLSEPCVALNSEANFNTHAEGTVRVYLYANSAFRAELLASDGNMDQSQALKVISEIDTEYQHLYLVRNQCEMGLTENYDMSFNVAFCNVKDSTRTIRNYVMFNILQECLSEL